MIENVARAIWEQQRNHWGPYRDIVPDLCEWEELTQSKQRELLREAKAAIAAMPVQAEPQWQGIESDAASENAVKWKPAAEDRAAAVIRTYGDERYQAAIDDVVKWLRRDGDRVASVSTPRMQTDNLAIILCNQFDNPDQQSDDDTGWTPDAVEGCDEAIGAVVAYFTNEITRRFGKGE